MVCVDAVKNRFMFDTSALNSLFKSTSDDINRVYASKEKGFEYYFTETQLEESENNINSKENAGMDTVSREAVMRAIRMLKLIANIQKEYVGRIATLTPNRWVLDGTFEILPEGEDEAIEVYKEILHDNPVQHYNDAVIALTGLVNGCTLVVNDKRFRNAVNRHFSGRAIHYNDFLKLL